MTQPNKAAEALREEAKVHMANGRWALAHNAIDRLAALASTPSPAVSAHPRFTQQDADEWAERYDFNRTPTETMAAFEDAATWYLTKSEVSPAVSAEPVGWKPGTWYEAKSVDDMQSFFCSRLPAIREAARLHGYAIGVHGSERRDFDLIAAPWREDASDAETLAKAVAIAACGIACSGPYDFERKPLGRLAVSIPICWTSRRGVPSDGHIDLSVMPAVHPAPAEPSKVEALIDMLLAEANKADDTHADLMRAAAEALATQPNAEPAGVPYFNRRAVERAIESAENPQPGTMCLNDGRERVILPGGTLRRMLSIIDMLTAAPAPQDKEADRG